MKAAVRIKDVVKVIQRNRLQWCGHVLRKDDDAWVKKNVLLWRLRMAQETMEGGSGQG